MGEKKNQSEASKTIANKPTTTVHSKPTSAQSPNPTVSQPAQPTTNEPTTAPKAQEASSTPKDNKANPTNPQPKTHRPHTALKVIIFLVIIFVFLGTLIILWIIGWLAGQQPDAPNTDKVDFPDPIYSNLTGEEISDASLNNSPTFCIQIPNGLDGARPQAGLNQAAIVFEAIAEAGITRFAAIFQNPTSSAIGPIRSLRPYYLEWDTPFDCTITHAGGSDEALAALRQGNYRNLDESLTYMWRESSNRGWNNLFTSSDELINFNNNLGYTSSSPQSFPHLTPDEVELILAQNLAPDDPTECSSESAECATTVISNIAINFGISPLYNTYYTYDSTSNSYYRYYATGDQHLTYDCPADLYRPNTLTDCGDPQPVAPNTIIAMVVSESLMADGYHENIRTIGSGTATIFQNGEVIEGSWTKNSANEQIIFRDATGNIVKLTPGQTWIAAIPQYGKVSYETIILE